MSDQGIGIDEKDIKLLFKPFGKLKNGEQYNPNGIGLGLSICKGILDQMNCDICVVSSQTATQTTNLLSRIKKGG